MCGMLGKKNNPGRNPKENTNNKNINLLKLLLNNRFIIVIFTSLAPSDVKQTDGVWAQLAAGRNIL